MAILTPIAASLALLSAGTLPAHPRGEIGLGRGTGITITPGGDLWLGAGEGHLYVSHDGARTWVPSDRIENPALLPGDSLKSIEAIGFFDDQHGLAVGESLGKAGQFLQTLDGGKTWSQSQLGISMVCSCLRTLPDGHAWISGPDGILLSADWGQTWSVTHWAGVEEYFCGAMDFPTGSHGIVASSGAESAILLTTNGGKAWRTIPVPRTPFTKLPDWVQPEDVYVEHVGPVAMVEYRALVRAELMFPVFDTVSEVLIGTLGEDPKWELFTIDGAEVQTFCRDGDGIVAQTKDGRVVFLSSRLKPLRVVPAPSTPNHGPVSFQGISARAGHVVLFDGSAHTGVVDQDSIRIEHLFTPNVDPSIPIRQSIASRPDYFLGVSGHFLYARMSPDSLWERLAELPAPGLSLQATKTGRGLFLGRPGVLLWRDDEQRFERPVDSEHYYATGELKKDDLWILFGMVAPDEHHADIRTNCSDTVLAGEPYTGVVFASADGGDSWVTLDRWPGGRVEALDLDEHGCLAIYRAGGGIRRGSLDLRDPKHPKANLHTLVEPGPPWEERFDWPYVQYGIEIKFADDAHGTVIGGMFFEGHRAFETDDGGKSWRRTLGAPRDR